MDNSIYYRNKPIRDINPNQTMYSLIKELSRDNLETDAVSFYGTKYTFDKLLNDRVMRLADAYHKCGVKEGSSIAIITVNLPLVQENLLALSFLGAISKWIDVRNKNAALIRKLNESDCEIALVFDQCFPLVNEVLCETNLKKVIIASPKEFLNPIVKVISSIEDKKENKKQIEIPSDPKFVRYTKFINSGSKNNGLTPALFEKDRPSIVVQSSGSTGISKSLTHTEYNFNSSMVKESYTDLPMDRGGSMYCAIPPFIIYGLNNQIYAALTFGLTADLIPYVTDDAVYKGLGKFDFSCGAPLHYRYIYNRFLEIESKLKALENEKSPTVKKEINKLLKEYNFMLKGFKRALAFISGGDSISAEEIQSMQQTFGTVLVNGYGNNELSGAAVISPIYGGKPKSVGITMKGIDIATFDPENGTRLANGMLGEICMHSDNAFVEYIDNEEETKRVKQLHDDGQYWIHTGDLGYVDEDGFVYIVGRSKRLIKRTAYKIAPIGIENAISRNPQVKDVVAVGVPDKEDGAVPMAFIQLKDEYLEEPEKAIEDIKTNCYRVLSDYQVPKYFEIIDQIPYKNNKQDFSLLEKKERK